MARYGVCLIFQTLISNRFFRSYCYGECLSYDSFLFLKISILKIMINSGGHLWKSSIILYLNYFTAVLSHTCTARIKCTAIKREVGGRQSNCVYKTQRLFTSVGLRNMSESDDEIVVGIPFAPNTKMCLLCKIAKWFLHSLCKVCFYYIWFVLLHKVARACILFPLSQLNS